MEFSIERLDWLRPAPAEFRSLAKVAGSLSELALLSNHALDLNKLTQLDRAVARVGDAEPGVLSPLRLAVLADATTDYIAPAIRASALRHGVLVTTYFPDYGQSMNEAMSPGGRLAEFGADMALLAPDHRSLGLDAVHASRSAAAGVVSRAIGQIEAMLDGLAQKGVKTVILQTIAVPPDPWLGHFDRRAPGAISSQVIAFNSALADLAERRTATVLDIAALADLVGRARWSDASQWNRAKLTFALELVPLYADHVGRILGSLRGKSRKCLVLDLDNTLWGGVIGDDGLDGIRIGQGTAEGEAFLGIQQYALKLKTRGVVLAVCSKNEEDAARLPFRQHPDMALREDDIAVFIANWTDKATNIRHIAKVLNIGTDALVFLDDNPAERERVRQMMPEVAVPELPPDPVFYATAVAQAGYFESAGLSDDDLQRAEQYRANAERSAAVEKFGDYDSYLTSMEMHCDLSPFDDVGRTRIAQLINKSNQFNLTTRRYTEADVAQMQGDAGLFTLQVRLVDKFGDNGMISVIVFRKGDEEWLCDTWLMSCRVLGRRVQEAVLASVAKAARAAGATRLVGEYIPSAKNRMVADHFPKLGFEKLAEGTDGSTRWQLQLADYVQPELPMRFTGALAIGAGE